MAIRTVGTPGKRGKKKSEGGEPEVMALTANQILQFDEIGADRRGINAALEVAMNFHSNRMNEIHKREQKLWEELGDAFGLDLDENRYRVEQVNGVVQVIEVKEEEG